MSDIPLFDRYRKPDPPEEQPTPEPQQAPQAGAPQAPAAPTRWGTWRKRHDDAATAEPPARMEAPQSAPPLLPPGEEAALPAEAPRRAGIKLPLIPGWRSGGRSLGFDAPGIEELRRRERRRSKVFSFLIGIFIPPGWRNVTFATFAIIITLTAIGLVGVYTSSAAIVGYRENLLRSQRLAREQRSQSFTESVALSTRFDTYRQIPEGYHEIFGNIDLPSYHSSSFLWRQMMWLTLGLFALLTLSRIDYNIWKKWSGVILLGTIVLLILVFVPGIGKSINGARRWVGFGPIGLQPSELARLAVVLYFAKRLSETRRSIPHFWKGFVANMMILGVVAALILKEPDLGATACVGLIAVTMFFAAGMRLMHLALLIPAGLALLAVEMSVPFRRARLLAFLNPEEYFHTHAWQLNQSLIAIGSGGIFGTGLGAGPQKYQYLSTAFSDFVYAILSEELGLLASMGIPLLFAALFICGIYIAWNAPDFAGALIAVGITCMFTMSATIHMAVNLGLVPTKGLTLPFVSYGGTSLLINLAAAGVLINVAIQGELHRAGVAGGNGKSWFQGSPSDELPALPDGAPTPGTLQVRRGGTTREFPLLPEPPANPQAN